MARVLSFDELVDHFMLGLIQPVPGSVTLLAALLTDPERRGLTPLLWTHVLPYGEIAST